MELLKRYYDKLILGVLLLALVVSMVVLSSSLNQARASVEINDKAILDKIYNKPKLDPIDVSQFDTKIEPDNDRLWQPDPTGEDSTLVGPGKYVYALDGSGYILHVSDKKNDFTQSPDIDGSDNGKDPIASTTIAATPTQTLDPKKDQEKDGLPDEWEEKYGLSNQSFDQFTDNDRDGFTALEEFQANTNPADQKSHPRSQP